jgi:hypothetical protein
MVLHNMLIRNNYAWHASSGGALGAFLYFVLRVYNSQFIDNWSSQAAIYSGLSVLETHDCYFENNTGVLGGAVQVCVHVCMYAGKV